MKITQAIWNRIARACNKECGGKRQVEIGDFHWDGMPEGHGYWGGMNALLVDNDSGDLDSTYEMDFVTGCDIPDDDGWILLDCYCYTTEELDTNIYVLLDKAGKVRLSVGCGDPNTFAKIDQFLKAQGHHGWNPA